MKKMLIAAAVVMAAVCANASYLYWQVSGTETGLSNGTLNGHEITGYSLVAINSSGVTTTLSSVGETGAALSNPISTTLAADGVFTDLSSYTTGYSFYIEVTGYDSAVCGSNTGAIGQSNTFAYSDLAGHLTSSLSAMSQAVTAMVGTAYGAPEPTSGLLLLVGTALLALRRRKA